SEKGYRYYVDHVIVPSLKGSNINIMKHIMKDGFYEIEQVVQKSAEVLSDITHYTSIMLGPEIFATKLKQLQIIPLSHRAAAALLITDAGQVELRSLSSPREISASDVENMVDLLNDRLTGVLLYRLQGILNNEITD